MNHYNAHLSAIHNEEITILDIKAIIQDKENDCEVNQHTNIRLAAPVTDLRLAKWQKSHCAVVQQSTPE